MADLDTITLSELEEVNELLETDTLLVERNGRIKRFTGEVGGGNDTLIVEENSNHTLNKTFGEIKNAIDGGSSVYVNLSFSSNMSCTGLCTGWFIYQEDFVYNIFVYNQNSIVTYTTNELNGYPNLYSNDSGGVN